MKCGERIRKCRFFFRVYLSLYVIQSKKIQEGLTYSKNTASTKLKTYRILTKTKTKIIKLNHETTKRKIEEQRRNNQLERKF